MSLYKIIFLFINKELLILIKKYNFIIKEKKNDNLNNVKINEISYIQKQ